MLEISQAITGCIESGEKNYNNDRYVYQLWSELHQIQENM